MCMCLCMCDVYVGTRHNMLRVSIASLRLKRRIFRTSVKGGAQMCCVNAATIDNYYASRLSPE